MENNNQRSFWQFSDQLRGQNPSLANLSLNDSIWSNSYLSKRTDGRRNFDIRAASFGGTNIDPTAWEDKKCPGQSRFPAQVRVLTRKICEPLEEDSFRPILHHYDGPKFRLELNIPEALSLLDIFAEQGANLGSDFNF